MASSQAHPQPHRILIVGKPGSGKSTLAGRLSKELNIPNIELDSILWQPNWTELPKEEFNARVTTLICSASLSSAGASFTSSASNSHDEHNSKPHEQEQQSSSSSAPESAATATATAPSLAADKETIIQTIKSGPGGWVIDGNCNALRPILWATATHFLWLDYSLLFTLFRLTRRTARRVILREPCCNGNIERWSNVFCINPEENLFLWTIKNHWRHRKRYTTQLAEEEYGHLVAVRFRSPGELEKWLDEFVKANAKIQEVTKEEDEKKDAEF
jgi:hypothetical protein